MQRKTIQNARHLVPLASAPALLILEVAMDSSPHARRKVHIVADVHEESVLLVPLGIHLKRERRGLDLQIQHSVFWHSTSRRPTLTSVAKIT